MLRQASDRRRTPCRPRASGARPRLIAPLLLASISLAGCAGEPPTAEPEVRPVRVERVQRKAAQRLRTFSGVARAGVESGLSFRVGGTLVALPVEVGDRVRSGQVIARLDPVDYELQVEEAEAALAQAEAGERNAEATYDRVRRLYENNNASRADLDAARASAESAAAQVAAADKRIELYRQRVGYTVLRSPDDGAIAAVRVDVNENVRSGQPVVLLTTGGVMVEVAVPEALISGIRRGDAATVTFDSLPGRGFAATVTEVGVASLGSAPTFPVRVRLEEQVADVRPGMAAEASIHTGGGGERIVVPPVAVLEDRTGRFAFVVDETDEGRGVARRREVTVGELRGDGLEVLSGLDDGELLITAGARRLEDGTEVRLPAERRSAGPETGGP
ncbi:MAG: efflux RND transporter periplasmic adaptor subunit [Acidobacteriota bacterium]|jgi:RND family efflux transporter MFP subunit